MLDNREARRVGLLSELLFEMLTADSFGEMCTHATTHELGHIVLGLRMSNQKVARENESDAPPPM